MCIYRRGWGWGWGVSAGRWGRILHRFGNMGDSCAGWWYKILKAIWQEPATTRSCWFHLLLTRTWIWIWILFNLLFELLNNYRHLVTIIKKRQSFNNWWLTSGFGGFSFSVFFCFTTSARLSKSSSVRFWAPWQVFRCLPNAPSFGKVHPHRQLTIVIRTKNARNQRRHDVIWSMTGSARQHCWKQSVFHPMMHAQPEILRRSMELTPNDRYSRTIWWDNSGELWLKDDGGQKLMM